MSYDVVVTLYDKNDYLTNFIDLRSVAPNYEIAMKQVNNLLKSKPFLELWRITVFKEREKNV